ncbi:SEC14-like protein 2 isoform X2 [Argiope bruennichi]|uniref:SEC14-like protein 2 isoform X2 n=1 Tax=Argiope bruennichi TaxID=94029 RepID=UPI002493E8C4|nr:SEC14-like protein 2 isoform X2 [Argiope bruennichi]
MNDLILLPSVPLRKRVGNELTSEHCNDTNMFYRFLKARDFHIDHAEDMLRKHIQWRKEYSVDTILHDYIPHEALSKYFPGNLIGFDKENCPVKYFAFGNMDAKGVRRSANFPEIMKYVIYIQEKEMEVLKQQSRKLGRELPGSVYILDFKNMTLSDATDMKTMEHASILSRMYQDNYPERLKAVYIINVSPYFYIAYNIIKVFIVASILRKVHICKKDFQDKLLKIIDGEQLPAFLGGNRTDPDGNPLCKSFVNHAGIIPAKYFKNKCSKDFKNKVNVHKLNVARMSTEEVQMPINEAGLVIEWEFEIQYRDIEFGLYFQDRAGNRFPIIPVKKVDEEEFTETGTYRADKAGTYIFVFNNSYSWMRSKDIIYRIVVRNLEDNLSD